MQEGQNFSSERAEISQDCTSNTFWMPPSLPMSGYQFSRGKIYLCLICRQKKIGAQSAGEKRWGPICLEAHTPLWQGRKVSEIHFLRGEASLIFPPIGKGVPMPHQCSGCNTPAPVFDICQYSRNLTFYTNTNAGYHSWTNIFAQSFKSECRTSAALRPKPRVSQTKWDAASITLIR